MRYLGIDYGTRRIGLAISDPSGSMAFPDKVVTNNGRESAAAIIVALAKEKGVEEIVLGESKNFQGEPNDVQADIEAFKILLEKDFIVHYQNETMSSAEAARSVSKAAQAERSGESRDSMLDASAAAIILNSFLTRKRLGL